MRSGSMIAFSWHRLTLATGEAPTVVDAMKAARPVMAKRETVGESFMASMLCVGVVLVRER